MDMIVENTEGANVPGGGDVLQRPPRFPERYLAHRMGVVGVCAARERQTNDASGRHLQPANLHLPFNTIPSSLVFIATNNSFVISDKWPWATECLRAE